MRVSLPTKIHFTSEEPISSQKTQNKSALW
jgi:hypothetical protein